MANLSVVSAPTNQPILTGVVDRPSSMPTGKLPVVSKPASLPAKLPVVSKPANVQSSLSVASPAQQPSIYVPPRPPEPPKMDKIASDIGVARSRKADDTTILYSLLQKNPTLIPDVKTAIEERKATPTQVLDAIVVKYAPAEEPTSLIGKIKRDIQKRQQNTDKAKKATAEGEQTRAELLLQGGGQAAGLIGDVIGQVINASIPDFVKKGARKVVDKIAEQPINPFIPLGEVTEKYEAFAENNPRLARNTEAIANIASSLPTGKVAKVATTTAIEAVETATKATAKTVGGLTRYGVSQATGLAPETITQIIKNPKAITVAQKAGLDRASLATRVKEGIDQRLLDLSETGKGYEIIRKTKEVVSVPEGGVDTVLNKYGLKLRNGKLIATAESVPLSQGDKLAIESFIRQYGNQKVLSGNAFLNTRKALTNLASFDATKTDISSTIARELRSFYDGLGKKQLSGLESLDGRYAPEIKLLNQIKRDYLNLDGTLKDGALNKIANLAGKGKDQVLARLEKVVPNIKEDINILKALEDIEISKGQKVGAYLRGASGGFVLSGGNPAVAILSAIVASPQIAVPILKTYGATINASKVIINRIVNKLRQGIKPLADEARVISQAIETYAKDFRDNPRIGLSIRDVSGRNSSGKALMAEELGRKINELDARWVNNPTPANKKALEEAKKFYRQLTQEQ